MKQEDSAYAELFRRGNVAFAGALPGDEHAFGRAKTLRATAFVFGDFDGESFVICYSEYPGGHASGDSVAVSGNAGEAVASPDRGCWDLACSA